MTSIQLENDTITINNLRIHSGVVAAFLSEMSPENRLSAVKDALEIGVYSLQRATAGQDLEFVRRQVEGLMVSVSASATGIPTEIEKTLLEKLGVEDGAALAPVRRATEHARSEIERGLNGVREMLSKDFDPASGESTLGKALLALKELLDPDRKGSIQSTLTESVQAVSSADGAIADTVAEVLGVALKPLREELQELGKEVRAQRAASDVASMTTLKGVVYEEELVDRMQGWARMSGATVEHTGTDNGSGDLVIAVPVPGADPIRVVVEAKDKTSPSGRRPIAVSLGRAMDQRRAAAAVYVCKKPEGLAGEIGDWAEGRCEAGPWVACVDQNLETAIRFVVVQVQLDRAREAKESSADPSVIRLYLTQVRDSLKRIANINRHAGSVRSTADAIRQEAEQLRDEVRDVLGAIEEAMALPNPRESRGDGIPFASSAPEVSLATGARALDA